MKVDFYNFEYVPEVTKNKWKETFDACLREGQFIGGDSVKLFEAQFSKIIGSQYSVGVSNGYDGLELALRAIGIGPGSEVALPAHTFIATWNAVLAVGATPVGIDVFEDGQIDTDALIRVVTQQKIECVIPVHMHGHVADLKTIKDLCVEREIWMIEDASQAHLASRDELKAGATGDIGVFSLYPTKNLGALGDAGVIVTNNKNLEQKIRSLSNYGSRSDNKYIHEQLGFNRRLDTLQARILSENLNFLEEWNLQRIRKTDIYAAKMNELGIKFLKGRNGSVWHHFCIFSEKREELRKFLEMNGIATEVHYPNLAAHEVQDFIEVRRESFPMAEKISKTILSLPLSPFHQDHLIDYVCQVIERAHSEEDLF